MNTTTNTQLVAIIPNFEASIYDRFGLDIVRPAEYDDEGTCTRDMEPVQWIELGDFPDEDADPAEVRSMLDDAAAEAGFGIRWGTVDDTESREYYSVEVY